MQIPQNKLLIAFQVENWDVRFGNVVKLIHQFPTYKTLQKRLMTPQRPILFISTNCYSEGIIFLPLAH